MSPVVERAILDTNVWLDFFLPDRIRHEEARRLVANSIDADIDLLYPVHAVPDIFYLAFIDIKRMLGREYPDLTETVAAAARATAWEYVNSLKDLATAVGADQGDVMLACSVEHLHPDVEDNLVLAAARRAHADHLVTNNQQLLAHAALFGVAAITTTEMIGLLDG